MSKNIFPISDMVFKYIFGSEDSTHILQSFLSSVLVDAGFYPVQSLDIRNPFNIQSSVDDKCSSTALERWMYYLWHRSRVMEEQDPILLQILKEDPDIEDAEARYQQFLVENGYQSGRSNAGQHDA